MLCGTFSASAGASEYLVFHGSGSSGSPIVLECDPSNTVTIEATYWSGAVIDIAGNSYLTLNGQNCTIEATANGTGLANQEDDGVGILSASATANVTIEYWTIQNMYVHTCTEPATNCTDQGGQDTYGIEVFTGSGAANLTITENTLTQAGKWSIFIPYGSGGTATTGPLSVDHNTISQTDHGVVLGDSTNGSILTSTNCSVAVHDNSFSDFQPWDASGDVNHHDGTHFWANGSSSEYSGTCLYNNYASGDFGSTDNTVFGMESLGSTNYIFNNVINVSGNSSCASGAIGIWTGTGSNSSTQHVFNNTISPTSNCTESQDFEETNADVFENNLVLSGNATYVYTDGTSGDLATADYNFYQTPAGANPFYGPSGCTSGASFSSWQSPCGYDTHGHNATVSVNSNFTLPTSSAAIGAGTNLTSLGITALDTGAPQTFGVNGACGTGCVARSSTGAWDVGAYPYQAAATSRALSRKGMFARLLL